MKHDPIYLLISATVLFSFGIIAIIFIGGTSRVVVAPTFEFAATSVPVPRDISMVFVGDIMLSRSVGDLMAQKNDYRWPFYNVSGYINSFDIAFANLENPVSARGVKVGSIYSFRADPRTLEGLKYAGFDVVSLANNHIWDYGRDAFLDTMAHLKNSGIDFIGAGNNFDEAHAGIIKEINGVKIGFLAYTEFLASATAGTDRPGITYFNAEQISKDVRRIKNSADIVAVSFHWGEEYRTLHNQKQEEFAKVAIGAGADLIIGHHPHVGQDIQREGGAWAVYSLGNFVFDQNWSEATRNGLALEVRVKNGKISEVVSRQVFISTEYQPSIK